MSEKPNLPEFPDRNILLEYLKGGLKPSERHRIEKLMLENSSFREAMESLESEEPELIEADLYELSGQIRSRSGKTSGTGFSFYRLAATISFIILASVIVFMVIDRISQSRQEKNLSFKQDAQTETVDSLIDEKSNRAEIKSTDPGYMAQKEVPENGQRTGKIRQEESGQAVAQLDNAPVSKQKPDQKMEVQPVIKPDLKRAERSMVTEDKELVSPAEVQFGMENQPLTEEKKPTGRIKGEQLLDGQDRLTSAEAEDDMSPPVALRSEEAARSVVMKTALPAGQPQPVNGITNYRKYLEDSLRYPVEAIRNRVEGVVLLNFTIGSDSIPQDIMVKQSLGFGCDREAIRLIREGPRWAPVMLDGQVKRQEVEIPVSFKIPQ